MARKKDYRTYAHIPIRAIKDPRFKRYKAAFRTLAAICSYSDFTGRAFPNQITLAKMLHVSRTAVTNQIKILKEMDYIRKSFTKPSAASRIKGNCYFIVFSKETSERAAVSNTSEAQKQIKPAVSPEVENVVKEGINEDKSSSNVISTCPVSKSNRSNISSSSIKVDNKYSREDLEKSRIVCNRFKDYCKRYYGKEINYYMKNMEEVAELIAKKKLHTESLLTKLQSGFEWLVKNNRECPYSIRFFYRAWSKEYGRQNIVKRTSNMFKL
jgi:DNA-binding Lrp family transcriptional regulator